MDKATDKRLAPMSIFNNKPSLWDMAVYFFLFTMVITRVMIETISKLKANKSFTVMYSIGNTPFQGQDLTAYRLGHLIRQNYIITFYKIQYIYKISATPFGGGWFLWCPMTIWTFSIVIIQIH